jgi:broad specificity phosphatase PhoE
VVRHIYMARHGETEWNRVGRWQGATDIPLSDVGRAQARHLAERLRDRGITAVHASDLARARETAEIVATALGLPAARIDPRLRERGFGCFEGLTQTECAERFPDAWALYAADRRLTPPDAEPQAAVVARIHAAMIALATADADPEAGAGLPLVISHGGALRSFASAVIGRVPPPVPNGGLFVARFEDGRFVAVDLA